MKKARTFFVVNLLVAFLIAISNCGGGEKSAEKAPAESDKPMEKAEPMPAGNATVMGTVTYTAITPEPERIDVNKDVEICGKTQKYSEDLVVSESGGIKNVVVRIMGATGGFANGEEPSIVQEGCKFSPHVAVVPTGRRMAIYNNDGIAHNIHTLSTENSPFNKQQPGHRKRMFSKKTDFEIPEVFKVKCDIHGWMKAWIVVTDNPYVAVTDESGSFKIEDVPAGTYKVEYWHETLGTQTSDITVEEDGTVTADASFEPAS